MGTETLHPPAVQTPLNTGAFHPTFTGARREYSFRAQRGKDAQAGCEHVQGYLKRLLNQYGNTFSLVASSVSLLMASVETHSGWLPLLLKGKMRQMTSKRNHPGDPK